MAPPVVWQVLQAVMFILGKDFSLCSIKKQISSPGLLQALRDVDVLDQGKLKKLEGFTKRKNFNPLDVSRFSVATCILCEWVLALQLKSYNQCCR